MHDATGQVICLLDLVKFKTTAGHHDRGLAMKSLPGKKFRVLLVDGTEVAKKACDLTVVDRNFLCPGMAVAPASSDPGQQVGVITGVTTALDLVKLDGAEPTVVATDVSPAEVRPIKELTLGAYVVSGTWLGRVVELSVDVDVLFDDRSVCRVTRAGDRLRILSKGFWSRRNKNGFYPGEAVAGDASVFKSSQWLKGYWKPTRGEGTVAKVEMGGVLVCWVASLQMGTEVDATQATAPPAYQPTPRNLTFFCAGGGGLMWFWGVSARCFFRSQHHHATNQNPASGPKKKHRHGMRMGVKKRLRRAEFERPMTVADTHTTVDVLWQDGTRQRGVPSPALLCTLVRNEQDFFPGQRVVAKMLSPVAANDNAAGRVGVVKSLSYKDQTVCVSWSTSSEDTMMLSTYDLGRSFDHNFFYGDMVVRLRPRASSPVEGGCSMEEETEPAQRSNKQATNNDLSWVGHIVDLCDAQYIHVKWGDGNTSKVLYPLFISPKIS
jgi:ubiquitin-conjugating enzyme E2 O